MKKESKNSIDEKRIIISDYCDVLNTKLVYAYGEIATIDMYVRTFVFDDDDLRNKEMISKLIDAMDKIHLAIGYGYAIKKECCDGEESK